MSTPGTSGKSTPLLTATSSSTRSKPVVLETSHLHLQTHGPSGRRMINQYVIEDELGRGVHGKVRLARDTETGEKVAVKIVEREGKKRLGAPSRDQELERQREKERKRLLWTTDQKVKREIAIMKKLAHENIVRLKEVIDDPASKKVFMVLEYMEGGEVQWKDERGFPTLTVDEARRTLRDIVLGLEYLHYQGIIHRDIKPANLLLDKDQKVKISDFGVSHFSYALLVANGGLPSMDSDTEKQKDPSLADDRELAKTAGSPAFFAPELCLAGEAPSAQTGTIRHTEKDQASTPKEEDNTSIQNRSRPPITKAIDVWALGVTLYCLLFGHVPFTADNEFALFSVITREDYELPAHMGADRIQIGPRRKRWIYQQPWTDEEGDVDEMHENTKEADVDVNTLSEEALMVRDLLDRLLEKDPSKRIKLDEVKKHPWLTRDLENPPLWLSETDPSHLPFVEVTHEDVETALTGFNKFKQTLKRLQNKFWS
ncbi:kinase-like protein, partial [Meira miltonrushii]